jgi:4,5:9,10-diseco-3-hydroxy-5,9,17-trioxoandrosta-1(10),2-diene-4-oate hydrolase
MSQRACTEESTVESTVVVQGVRVHYTQTGSGPALVLVHGIVGSGRNWNRNIEFLSRFRTVYAIDMANMGSSERVKGLDAGLEACADRLAAWMEALGIESADVAGHSHGGATAMILAARHPERVRRLVLFAPANPFCTQGHAQMRFYATRFGAFFACNVIPLLPRILYRRSLERMYGDPKRIVEGTLEGYADGLDSSAIAHILAIMRRWTEDMRLLQAALPDLAGVPMLLFWGDQDRAVTLLSGKLLAKTLGVRLQVVADAGHIAFEEMPDICNPMVGEWLLN